MSCIISHRRQLNLSGLCDAESIMWPGVPQLYQTYRLWQLLRGCALTQALNGPEWLWDMQAFLLLMWYFNFAAVTIWMPWLYKWHSQPAGSGSSKGKSQ